VTNKQAIDAFVTRILNTILARHGGQQVFLFGPAGEPFWCARHPFPHSDLGILSEAVDLIERKAANSPKPFLGHDSAGRFTVAALGGDSDLYLVAVNEGPDRIAAEARVAKIRSDLVDKVASVRNAAERATAGL
jgi:hypothetical protein